MKKPQAACFPPDYIPADIYALKALQGGTASMEQQRRALDWIIKNACCTYDLSYRPESERETAFAEGRRFVGLQIVKALNFDMALLGNKEQS